MKIQDSSVAAGAQTRNSVGRAAPPTGIERNLERGTFNGSVARKLAERFGIVTSPPTAVELYSPSKESYVPPAPIDVRPSGDAPREAESQTGTGEPRELEPPSESENAPDPQTPLGVNSATVAAFTGIDRADKAALDIIA